jgi:hypothetical protein
MSNATSRRNKRTIESFGLEKGPRTFTVYALRSNDFFEFEGAHADSNSAYFYYTNLESAKQDKKRLRANKRKQGFRCVSEDLMRKVTPEHFAEGGRWVEKLIQSYITEITSKVLLFNEGKGCKHNQLNLQRGKLWVGEYHEVYSGPVLEINFKVH